MLRERVGLNEYELVNSVCVSPPMAPSIRMIETPSTLRLSFQKANNIRGCMIASTLLTKGSLKFTQGWNMCLVVVQVLKRVWCPLLMYLSFFGAPKNTQRRTINERSACSLVFYLKMSFKYFILCIFHGVSSAVLIMTLPVA